jgi:hypothetical protein
MSQYISSLQLLHNDKQLRAGKNVVCALYFVRTQHFSFSVLHKTKSFVFSTSNFPLIKHLKMNLLQTISMALNTSSGQYEGVSPYLHYLLRTDNQASVLAKLSWYTFIMKYKMIPNPATTWKCTDRATASKTSSFFMGYRCYLP